MNIGIKSLEEKDWSQVVQIYQQGFESGMATFETEVPSWQSWNDSHIQSCRLVAFSYNKLIGWAALSPVSSRCVYEGVAEVSIYIDTSLSRKGIGSKLLEELILKSENAGFWTLQSGIFPQNIASIKLHEKMGFRKIGFREKVAQKEGIWYDNVLMERRSKIIGID